jgi:hypothetical protein
MDAMESFAYLGAIHVFSKTNGGKGFQSVAEVKRDGAPSGFQFLQRESKFKLYKVHDFGLIPPLKLEQLNDSKDKCFNLDRNSKLK